MVNAARGRWDEAVPFLEREVKLNPRGRHTLRLLAVAYAQTGRIQEARDALHKATEGWPDTMNNLRYVMCLQPFKDLQVLERFAEGFLKGGIPGEPSGFYKISEEERLAGKEIEELVFGRNVAGIDLMTGKPWRVERKKDGKAKIQSDDGTDTGESWIKDDMLCDRWDSLYEGLEDCRPIYRNPEGIPGKNDEYLGVPDYGVYPFSVVE